MFLIGRWFWRWSVVAQILKMPSVFRGFYRQALVEVSLMGACGFLFFFRLGYFENNCCWLASCFRYFPNFRSVTF
jgi:hypothetical protein